MSDNSLLDSLSRLVTPDLISKASVAFGDNEGAIGKGLGAALPVLLGSAANRAGDNDFMSALFDLARDPANDGSLLDNVSGLLSPGSGSSAMMALGS